MNDADRKVSPRQRSEHLKRFPLCCFCMDGCRIEAAVTVVVDALELHALLSLCRDYGDGRKR